MIRSGDPVTKCDYEGSETPADYVCAECRAVGVKLWRQAHDAGSLLCGPCALKDQDHEGPLRSDGKTPWRTTWTGHIGNLLPAVPTPDNDTFWGYTSVPQDGVEWWKRLPLEVT